MHRQEARSERCPSWHHASPFVGLFGENTHLTCVPAHMNYCAPSSDVSSQCLEKGKAAIRVGNGFQMLLMRCCLPTPQSQFLLQAAVFVSIEVHNRITVFLVLDRYYSIKKCETEQLQCVSSVGRSHLQ